MEECKLWEEEREFSQYYTVYVFCNMHIFVILFVSFFYKEKCDWSFLQTTFLLILNIQSL